MVKAPEECLNINEDRSARCLKQELRAMPLRAESSLESGTTTKREQGSNIHQLGQ